MNTDTGFKEERDRTNWSFAPSAKEGETLHHEKFGGLIPINKFGREKRQDDRYRAFNI